MTMNYSYVLPTQIILFIVLQTYSILTPLILIPGTLYFGFSWIIAKNQFLFVYDKNRDTFGRYWTIICNRCVSGMYLSQIIFASILALKQGISLDFI